jgi:HSP20 family protein
MFDNFFGRTPLMPFEESSSAWESGPPVDIYDDDKKLTFKVEMPGIDEKDIKVEIDNNVLTVRGERRFEKDFKEENFRRMDRPYTTR